MKDDSGYFEMEWNEPSTSNLFKVDLASSQVTNTQTQDGTCTRTVFVGYKALVAEDNIINQMVLKGMLEVLEVKVEVVDNGLNATTAVISQGFDFVLMDVHMPTMDGIEATRKIRLVSQVPIIGVSANVMAENVHACMESGMNGFLPKPITRLSLVKEIERVLSLRTRSPGWRAAR